MKNPCINRIETSDTKEVFFKQAWYKRVIYLFLLLFVIQFQPIISHGQSEKISLKADDATLRDIFKQIEQKSDYLFNYKDTDISDLKASVNIQNASIQEALSTVLKNTGLTYSINNRSISIIKGLAPDNQPLGKDITVSGTIVDGSGGPLIAASVLVKEDTRLGAVTDDKGQFTITIPQGSTLIFSYIGFTNQEVTITTQTNLNIQLKNLYNDLDEVVVVGYGTQRRGSVIGSVTGIDNKEIAKVPVADLTNGLTGKLPGLRVVTRNGEPGWNASDIDIRGFGSALIIVDGVPSEFSQLDPNEIDNISVLKDASAAVYGVKAANGVILVTTKRGRNEKTRVNFNTTLSWQRPTIYPKMANAAQFVELTDEDKINRGSAPLYGADELKKWQQGGAGYESTDWYDEIVRPFAPQQQYNLNIRGGKEEFKYFASIGYVNSSGMWKSGSNNFDRFNLRTNVDAKITKGLSTSLTISGRKEMRDSPFDGAGLIMSSIARNYPMYKPYADAEGQYYAKTNVAHQNPVVISSKDAGYYRGETKVFEGSGSLNYDFEGLIDGLTAKAMYYYRSTTKFESKFRKKYNLYEYNEGTSSYNVTYTGNDPSHLTKTFNDYNYATFQGSLNYVKTFGKHDIVGLFLVETRDGDNANFNAYREYIIDSLDELNAGTDKNKTNGGSSSEESNIGYVGRINYAYDNKYLFEFSFRYDGSSKFPSNSRWGFFPSVSLGWRVSQENFIKNNLSFINDLKLRATWGRLGDDDLRDPNKPSETPSMFQFLSGYTYPSGGYIFGPGGITPGLTSKGLANPYITWYTADLYNIGLDARLWNGLLGVEVDVFYRKRNDLLATRVNSLPGTFGASLPKENLESDSDRGFEIILKHNNQFSNGIQYSIKGNVAYARSRWEHRERNTPLNSYDNWKNNDTERWKNRYWGYKAIGQFQSYDEIANSPVQDGTGNRTLRPGDIKYLDYNNNGVIDGNDEHVIGRGDKPELTFGLDLSASWKGFDVSVFLQGAANFNAYFDAEAQNPFYNAANSYGAFYDRWRRADLYNPNSEWISGKYPSTYSGGTESNRKTSSFWLQNSSYLRIKDIQIGYSLPKPILGKLKLEGLRIFVSGYNMFTFTGLDLLDPEAASGRGTYYPQQKIISFGLNLTL